MSARHSFDEALDAAIDAVRRGAPVASVLAAYPEHRDELTALVTPLSAAPARSIPLDAARISAGYRALRVAVLDARREPERPWWRRPVSLASLSVPAGIVALAAIGAAGAAAGGAAVATGHDVPATVHRIVTLGLQDGGGADNSSDRGNSTDSHGHHGAAEAPVSTGTPSPGAEPTHATGQPQHVSHSGVISESHGNVFTLTDSDGSWKVNIDGKTRVNGTIQDGATADVTGDATSTTGKELHADTVDVAATTGTPGGDSAPTPGDSGSPGHGPDHTPGVPQGTPRSGDGGGASATARAGGGPDGTGPPGLSTTPHPDN